MRMPWLLVALSLLAACSSDPSRPEPPSTLTSPRSASLGELEDALESSVEALTAAVRIEATELVYLDGRLSRSLWATSWSNGDWISVESTDLSVAEGETTDVVTTRARARIGDMFYAAGTDTDGVDSSWTATELTETSLQDGGHFLPISVPLGVIRDGSFLDPDEVSTDAMTVQTSDTTGDGTLWTLELSLPEDASSTSRWEVTDAGHLAFFSMDIVGLPIPAGPPPAISSPDNPPTDVQRRWEVFIGFTPHDGPEQAAVPPIGEPLDLQALDVPDDMPLVDD